MNEARDLQHPDITAAEKTGYPWFPRPVTVQVTEADAKEFCRETFLHFWEFLMVECPYTIAEYIDEHQDDFFEWKWIGE